MCRLVVTTRNDGLLWKITTDEMRRFVVTTRNDELLWKITTDEMRRFVDTTRNDGQLWKICYNKVLLMLVLTPARSWDSPVNTGCSSDVGVLLVARADLQSGQNNPVE